MSATPEHLIRDRRAASPQNAGSSFWQWVAIGVLMCCWLAEGTLCAARGF